MVSRGHDDVGAGAGPLTAEQGVLLHRPPAPVLGDAHAAPLGPAPVAFLPRSLDEGQRGDRVSPRPATRTDSLDDEAPGARCHSAKRAVYQS